MNKQTNNEKYEQTNYTQRIAAHYDRLYAEHKFLFDHNPLAFLNTPISELFPQDKPILDVGGGNAVAALSLAEMGYQVDVLDISSVAIANLQQKVRQENLEARINTIVGDIRTVSLPESRLYGGMIISLVLHHLTPNDARAVIQKLQRHTDVLGAHVLICFSNNGYLYRTQGAQYFFPSQQDVQALYAQWKIVQLDMRKDVPLRFPKGENNDALTLVARKRVLE